MDTDFVKRYGDLQQELDKAKLSLDSLNDDIRRIVGRPKDLRNEKHKSLYDTRRAEGDRHSQKYGDNLKPKRRNHDSKSVFNRLSAPTARLSDEETRPRLNSRVIRELPTRQEIVEAQGTDSESRARNRRMFGSLLGTLHKFCQEESRLKQKEEKKAQIERKLEEQELQERETIKREREHLFMDRKRKQLEIRRLEIKMSRLKDFDVWETAVLNLRHCIKTKTKPHIYFRPQTFNKKTEKLLSESQATLNAMMEKKRDALASELAELEHSLRTTEYDCEEQDEAGTNDALVQDTSKLACDVTKISGVNNSPVVDSNLRKGDLDFKENKSRNLNEPALSSSVFVVHNTQKDFNK